MTSDLFYAILLDAARNARELHVPPFDALPAPRIPLADLTQAILQVGEEERWAKGSEPVAVALTLLAPFSVLTRDAAVISRFTGIPRPLVDRYIAKILANEIWLPGGRLKANWASGPEHFILDVKALLGLYERVELDF
jgi:hypothetical protein